ncbi:MAG TPA: hypothetical protein VHO03_05595 [Ignavibacteriales bacterium]|nr:hypothetical protein [Ignavibacteriales bacterium]
MNNPRSNPVMSLGLFFISTALVIISVIQTYENTGKISWLLIGVLIAMNAFGIIRAIRLYRARKTGNKKPD